MPARFTQAIIIVLSMHHLQCYIALMFFFWISENVAKWNTNLITKHKKNDIKLKKSPYRDSNPDPQHCNPARYQWATTAVDEVAAKSRNESTYIHILTYLFLVRQPAVCIATALSQLSSMIYGAMSPWCFSKDSLFSWSSCATIK